MSFRNVLSNKLKRRNSFIAKIPWRLTSRSKNIITDNSGRIALCINRASLTVEAAVILPVFLMAMVMLIGVIDICRIKVEGQAELTQQAKKLSMYAYGAQGIYKEDYVDLFRVETYDLPVKLIPFGTVKIALRARVHTWTGRSKTVGDAADGSDIDTELVYVTDRETVYHTNSDCTYLNLSIFQVEKSDLHSLRNDYGARYDACEKCCGGSICSQYYVTENGAAYHTSLDCSGLKRSSKLIRKSEASHLQQCTRCQEAD